jgi:hypothetical protein
MPYYHYEDFKEACGNDMRNVIPINSVLKDAKELFNLFPKSGLLEFIYNDGLEDLTFVNTKKWEKNPNPGSQIYVDAYEFRSLNKLGYIAFMYNSTTKKWIIKSFHLSDNRNPAMYLALKKAGFSDMEENR